MSLRVLVALLLFLSAFDAWVTDYLLILRAITELNPLIAWAYGWGGLWGIVGFKALGLAPTLYVALRHGTETEARWFFQGAVTVYAVLFVYEAVILAFVWGWLTF